jgi:hypothetical protein
MESGAWPLMIWGRSSKSIALHDRCAQSTRRIFVGETSFVMTAEKEEIVDDSKPVKPKDDTVIVPASPLSAIHAFMDKHWVEIRMTSQWGAILLFALYVINSRSFKRLNTLKDVAKDSECMKRSYKVYVVHTSLDPQASQLKIYAYHTPWLRNMLGMHPSRGTFSFFLNQCFCLNFIGFKYRLTHKHGTFGLLESCFLSVNMLQEPL